MVSIELKMCQQPAAYVVRDGDGLEWFVCEQHGSEEAKKLDDDVVDGLHVNAVWVAKEEISAWFKARLMVVPKNPSRVCSTLVKDHLKKTPG